MTTIFDSTPELVLACAIVVIAQAVYVLFGFGAGLIAVGSMALFLADVQDAVVLMLLVGLPAEGLVIITQRRQIEWRGVGWLFAGAAVGLPCGALVLAVAAPTFLLAVLGAFLVVAGGIFLVGSQWRLERVPPWLPPTVGLVGGLLGGTFGTGGPPVVLYYQARGVDKGTFRGNLMAIFLGYTAVRLPVYWLAGLLTVPRVWSALLVLPAVALGAWIGHRAQLELSQELFRRLVSGGLVLIGAVLVIKQLW